MTSKSDLEMGAIVRLASEEWTGVTGIVSQPITEASEGHVLVYRDRYIFGLPASMTDVEPADKSSEGYAQLAYD
jgi:hypothetical protein